MCIKVNRGFPKTLIGDAVHNHTKPLSQTLIYLVRVCSFFFLNETLHFISSFFSWVTETTLLKEERDDSFFFLELLYIRVLLLAVAFCG